ncbi:WRKY19, partial [Symbiodinium necroappetens]
RLGVPGLLRVLEGPDQEAEAPGGGRSPGAQDVTYCSYTAEIAASAFTPARSSRAQGGGEVQACIAHGGGKREEAAALSPPDTQRPVSNMDGSRHVQCWDRLLLRSFDQRKASPQGAPHLVAELQRRLPWLGECATQLVWDCPVPGGCTLKRPDMLYRFEDRFVQVEVDEEGHEDLSCSDEDSRLELIAADVGLPGLVLRLNPDAEQTLKRRRLRNGEAAFAVGEADAFNALFASAETEVEAFLNEPAPEGVRVAGFPASWWDGR